MGSQRQDIRQRIAPPAMLPILLLVLPSLSLGQTQCGPFTTNDVEGPFFEPNAPNDKELAPRKKLNDPSQYVILQGQVRGRDCKGISGALVEVWYAGGEPGNIGYTFPGKNTQLWYRGKVYADRQGRYSFKATYPRRYDGRPIIHYHYKVAAGEPRSSSHRHTSREGSLQVTRTMSEEEKVNFPRCDAFKMEEGSPWTSGLMSDLDFFFKSGLNII